jgi:predicted PurR-regulated permease PerM
LNPFRGTRTERMDTLISLGILVGILAATLAVLVLLAGIFNILREYKHVVFLFVAGAIIAYLLAPLANGMQLAVRKRWAAILSSYLLLFLTLGVLAVLLVNPFISQARALRDNLKSPAAASLQSFDTFKQRAAKLQSDITNQQTQALSSIGPPASGVVQATMASIASLQQDLAQLESKVQRRGQITIPPSFLKGIEGPLSRLGGEYAKAFPGGSAVVATRLSQAQKDATSTADSAASSYSKASSSPILLLNLQLWLDQRGISVDLHDKFGQALQELSKQVANIVDNALNIALQAGNLLLNTVLILLISIYFLADGARFVHWLVRITPSPNRPRMEYFVRSLDQILGRYLRVQVLLALMAGTLDSLGAVALGVPYAVVIFLSSFFLSLVPVIGPVVLPIPPMIIALVFTSFPTPLIYLVWLLVGEQFVTNVVGPRLQGARLGIHPLEAMAAALLGFPVAGILGSFLAIPFVAFLHVVARSFVQTRDTMPQPVRLPSEPEPPAPAA